MLVMSQLFFKIWKKKFEIILLTTSRVFRFVRACLEVFYACTWRAVSANFCPILRILKLFVADGFLKKHDQANADARSTALPP